MTSDSHSEAVVVCRLLLRLVGPEFLKVIVVYQEYVSMLLPM